MNLRFVCFALAVCLLTPFTFAATINVPADQPSIQAGIRAAHTGDTVLVAPGTYVENINFKGKAITVKSSRGPTVTTIDGNQKAPVVAFISHEGSGSILSGFTLRNGLATFQFQYQGGGISIMYASPTITRNVIAHNTSLGDGGGIGINSGSPIIRGNTIIANKAPVGGGIFMSGTLKALISHNTISRNVGTDEGGGIAMNTGGGALIENNKITGNQTPGQGGGLWIVNEADEIFIQNLIAKNSAGPDGGGGVYLSVPVSATGVLFVNNTIADNESSNGSGIWAGGFDSNDRFFNNVIVGNSGEVAFHCDILYSSRPPIVEFDDAWASAGTGFDGSCADDVGMNGNISNDPLFVSMTNYKLQATSPAINAGTNSAPDLPSKDLANGPRIVGGTIDMGAYEYQ